MMKIIKQSELKESQKIQILELWNNEYPEKLTFNSIEDFENYLNKLSKQNHYLLLDEKDEINGWATTFARENEKWFAIIISGKLHGKGIGTKILNELKNNENSLNGWVIDHHSDKKNNLTQEVELLFCNEIAEISFRQIYFHNKTSIGDNYANLYFHSVSCSVFHPPTIIS